MKCHFKLILPIAFLIALTACENKHQLPKSPKIIIDFSKKETSENKLTALFNDVKIIPLETNEQCLLANIAKVIEFKQYFYVFDNRFDNVFMFSKNGRFIKKIGYRGAGPGEYIDISDIAFNENDSALYLLSVEKKEFMEFNYDGTYKRTVKLPFQATLIEVIDCSLAFYMSYYDREHFNLHITDLNGIVQYSKFQFPKETFPFDFTEVTGGMSNCPTGLLYTDATSNLIMEISKAGAVSTKYQVKFNSGDAWNPNKQYEFKAFFNEIQKGNVSFLGNTYMENNEALIFTYNQKIKPNEKKDLRKKKAFYLKKSNKLFCAHNFKDDTLYQKLSPPVGITQSGSFISTLPYRYYTTIIDSLDTRMTDEKLNPVLFIYEIIPQ